MSDTDVKAIQRRRGTASEFEGFTSGLEGEITVNTTNNSVVVSDGNMNNYEAARADMTNVDQFDMMKIGLADNNLTNTIYEYKMDAYGAVQQVRKSIDQIKLQLTSAYIADKDLTNVPLQIMLNKGVAKYTLLNVPVSAVSWDDPNFKEHIGQGKTDETGGGLAFRNLTNMKVETFSAFPTDDSVVTGNGLAYRTLSNVNNLSTEVKTQMGVASIDLSNVSDDTIYNKGGHRKYLMKRDLSNAELADVEDLTRAGIAQTDLVNIDFHGDETIREGALEKLGACNYNLDHVNLSVFTDKFHLMKDDGTNAVKDKVFKGIKNLLINGDFKEKHSYFSDVSLVENEIANEGDTFYSEWVAMSNGSKIHVSNNLATIDGAWGQCIGWDDSFNTLDSLYFSCGNNSSTEITVSLQQPANGGWLEVASSVINSEEGSDYDRYGCQLLLDHEVLLDKVPLMLVISGIEANISYCQLEKYNITNFYNTPSNYSRTFSGERSGRSCYLQIFDKLPPAFEEYYKLEPMFTSDGSTATEPVYYYALKSDGYVLSGDRKYVKYGSAVYKYVGDNFEIYCFAATGQFRLVAGDVTEEISKFKNEDLLFSEETKKIYTFANDGFYLMYDTDPYQGLLYIDGKYSSHDVFVWNEMKRDFETVSSSGSGLASLPLFAHIFSDRKLETVGWAESDSFTAQSASIYTGAYKYLVDQLHPVGTMLAGGEYGAQSSVSESATWLIEWSDNKYENTSISLLLDTVTAKEEMIAFCNSKKYTIDGAVYEEDPEYGRIIIDVPDVDFVNFVVRRNLEASNSNGVTYYKSFDGLNIVVETPDSAVKVNAAYNATGNGWFYMLHEADDLKDAYFRLPRVKGIPVTSGESEDVFGESYIENLEFTSSAASTLAAVKHKMYFYMGVPELKREEVAVNSVFAAISQFDTKLNKSVYSTQSVELETVVVGEGDEEVTESYAVAKLNQNIHEFVWKIEPAEDPEEEPVTTLRIDLTDLLGETDYDPVTKTYPAYVYNEFTKFEFKLVVDKSLVGADTEFEIKYFVKNNGGEDTLTDVPVFCNSTETVSNYYVYSNIVDGFNPDTMDYSRSMFVFKTAIMSDGLDTVHRHGNEQVAGEKSFLDNCNFTSVNATSYATALAPAVSDSSNKLVTSAFIGSKFQIVSALPANPDPNVFYFIPE